MSRQCLPVTRSVLSADALAPVLEQAYGFDVRRCRLIKALILHTYHVVAGDEQYIFRVYPYARRTKTAITAELKLINYLDAEGVPVSTPVPTKTGQYLLSFAAPEGERLAALFTYAPGVPLNEASGPDPVRVYGRTLATLHQLTDTMPFPVKRPSLDFNRLVTKPIEWLAETFPQRRQDWAELYDAALQLQDIMAKLGKESPVYGICHGDVSARNAHVTVDGRVTLFDFDFCGPSWRAYDLGTFLIGATDDVAGAFLAGYETVRTISPEESAALPAFQAVQNIWMLGMRASYVNEWGTAFISDRFMDSVLSTIKQKLAKAGIVPEKDHHAGAGGQ